MPPSKQHRLTSYPGHNESSSSNGGGGDWWSSLFSPGEFEKVVEDTQREKVDRQLEHAWAVWPWFQACISAFLFTFASGYFLIWSATVVPDGTESTTWPLDVIGPTIFYACLLWILSESPLGLNIGSIETDLMAIMMSWLFGPYGERLKVGVKSTVLYLSYIAARYGAWCLIDYLTSLFNGKNLADLAMPTQSIYDGFYGQMGNIAALVVVSAFLGAAQIEVMFVQRGVDPVRSRTASKVWYGRESDELSEEAKLKLALVMLVRFYIFMTMFYSPLDPGLLLTSPALSAANRISIGWYIGMPAAGYGGAILWVWFTEMTGFKAYSEKLTMVEQTVEALKGVNTRG